MIAVNHKNLHEQAILQNAARNAAENHRLWYVALTRASHRVYAMLQDQSAQSDSRLAFWRGQGDQVFQHALSLVGSFCLRRPPRPGRAVEAIIRSTCGRNLSRAAVLSANQNQFYGFVRASAHATCLQDDLVTAYEQPNSAADEIHFQSGRTASSRALRLDQAEFS